MKFYAKSPGNEGYIKNMEVIGFHDLNGVYAFQPALYKTGDGKYYIYYGSMKGGGVNILDVTDPAKPELVNWLKCADATIHKNQSTPKVQVCDDLLLVAMGGGIPLLHSTDPIRDTNEGGLKIYSLKEDPVHPQLLSVWDTGKPSGTVHRFCYNGGRYAHLSAEAPGFTGFIYRIIDIADPTKPMEVGRWWHDGQYLGNKTQKELDAMGPEDAGGVHCVYVLDDLAYLSCCGQGFKILDVSDVAQPKTIGELPMTPPFSGRLAGARSHTFLPIIGTNFAIGTHEGERFFCFSKADLEASGAQPMNNLVMIDVSNPADPVMVSQFPYPEVPEDFPFPNFNFCGLEKAGPFGPHNLHEPMTNKTWIENNPNRAYNCYFHAGLRVYDISDPYYVKELAYFIPPNPEKLYYDVATPGPVLGTAEDCVVDDRGNIFLNTMQDGMYVLRLTI